MGLDGYLEYLTRVIKILNNYTAESGENINFRNTSIKYQTVVAFSQMQDKERNKRKNK